MNSRSRRIARSSMASQATRSSWYRARPSRRSRFDTRIFSGYISDMSKKTPPDAALDVRIPAAATEKLDRAAEALGVHKKDLVAGLVETYVDPDSPRGLSALGSMATRKVAIGLGAASPTLGTYSFQA